MQEVYERTPAQQAASRLNGAKSRGPVSEAGKNTVSRNALKHGLTAKNTNPETLLLSQEAQEAFEEYRKRFLADLAPVGEIEVDLAERILLASWRVRRAWQLDAQVLELDRYEEDPDTGELIDIGLAECFVKNLPQLQTVHRYENRLNREYRWCRNELRRLQLERVEFTQAQYLARLAHAEKTAREEISGQETEQQEPAQSLPLAAKPSPPPPDFAGLTKNAQTNPSRLEGTQQETQRPKPPPTPDRHAFYKGLLKR